MPTRTLILTSPLAQIAAIRDGMTPVYVDSSAGVIGFVDITDPANSVAAGISALPDGEPTAVSAVDRMVFGAENIAENFTNPSGGLHAIDAGTRAVATSSDLGGGRVLQKPAGHAVIQPPGADGTMDRAAQTRVDLTGLVEITPEHPEPDFVDVNASGEIVVTRQDNKHLIVISATGEVSSHFSAGTVTLEGVDLT